MVSNKIKQKFIADLHIHSKYSRATSSKLTPEFLHYWAAIKGIQVLGTGDCLHSGWLTELKDKLEVCNDNSGFYKLREKLDSAAAALKELLDLKTLTQAATRFVLTTEISCIYKKNGRVRKIHNLVILPDFAAVDKFRKRLEKIGNLNSDGRPILGLDAKYLLEILLETTNNAMLVPAHIWTPWFSALGSKSGFDSIDECFEDLTKYIYALETGLSSDPAMNWLLSDLDKFNLISNSDAHSPDKLGREANIFNCELSYSAMINSLKTTDNPDFVGTIEFFPQEGKYHLDGHRKCKVCWTPFDTLKNNGICVVCNKPVTIGVLNRVAELCDRDDTASKKNKKKYFSIIPLIELLAEVYNKTVSSKFTQQEYFKLINKFGAEFEILLDLPINLIAEKYNKKLAVAIQCARERRVFLNSGYDGEFGKIKVFNNNISTDNQSLFSISANNDNDIATADNNFNISQQVSAEIDFDVKEYLKLRKKKNDDTKHLTENKNLENNSNLSQRAAIEYLAGPLVVIAGPGAGKTHILTKRIEYLITQKNIMAEKILAITFTNKAAQEIKERLLRNKVNCANEIDVLTFHKLGLKIITENLKFLKLQKNFGIIADNEITEYLIKLFNLPRRETNKIATNISFLKQYIKIDEPPEFYELFEDYNNSLLKNNLLDLDDLIYLPLKLFETQKEILMKYQKQYDWILIDEYQDINPAQFEFIKKLYSSENKMTNLFAIGDPDQTIYTFRGADRKFILNFDKYFENAKIIRLQKSFRCPSNIILAAQQILEKNDYLIGDENNPVKLKIQTFKTGADEADWIAAEIERLLGGLQSLSITANKNIDPENSGVNSFNDVVILCRASMQFESLKKSLEYRNIPYRIFGERPFYERQDFYEIFKPLELALLKKEFDKNKISVEIQELILKNASIAVILREFINSQNNVKTEIIEQFNLLITFSEKYQTSNYFEFFRDLKILRPSDFFDNRAECVNLMTIHSSKGLEFNCVFIAGCAEKILPFEFYEKKTDEELAEELRLLYVAMTRAKKYLFISAAEKYYFNNRALLTKKSVFLDKIEKKLVDIKFNQKKQRKNDILNLNLELGL